MTTDLVRTQGTGLGDKLQYAKALASANLLPRQYQNNPGNVLFALEYADALGVSPIHAITSIHVIEGKPSASADLIGSLVRRAGHKLRVTGDDTHARAVIIRADDPDFEYVSEWDMGKARAAGLTGKGVWKSYPGAMLRARAITEVARMGASDALYGVQYSPEELGANVNADGEVVDLGEQPAPPAPAEEPRTVTRQRKTGAEKLAEALPQADLATKAQIAALVGELNRAGHTEKADMAAAIEAQLGVRKSATQLTQDEAVTLSMFFADEADLKTAAAVAGDVLDTAAAMLDILDAEVVES